MSGQAEIDISVTFKCRAEVHDRAKFQREGHFVPGHITGAEVYNLSLHAPSGAQVLRVQAGHLVAATAAMRMLVPEHLWALHHATQLRGFDHEAYRLLNEQRNRFAQFIVQNYGGVVDPADPDGIYGVAVRYLRIERSRWRVRLSRWWRGLPQRAKALPSDENDMLDQSWKGDQR